MPRKSTKRTYKPRSKPKARSKPKFKKSARKVHSKAQMAQYINAVLELRANDSEE